MKHAVQRGILGTNTAFALGSRQTTENLDRVGRSQDLPDANRLLANSPAFKYANPNVSPYLCFALFEKSLHNFFLKSSGKITRIHSLDTTRTA
jgi:hypothetical protein